MAELAVALAGDQFTVSTVSQPDTQTPVCDLRTTPLQASAAVEDTRLIPLRPTTPFAASKSSSEFIEEGDEDTSLSEPPLNTLVSLSETQWGSPDTKYVPPIPPFQP